MAREKENYRTMLSFLSSEMHLPLLMTKQETCKALDVSPTTLSHIIRDGGLKFDNGRIPIGSVANYLCD